jgi:hypothetical protein
MGEIEQGDWRDLAAGSGTATAAGTGEGSWREWRAGRWLTGVAAWGRVTDGECAIKKRREQIFISI